MLTHKKFDAPLTTVLKAINTQLGLYKVPTKKHSEHCLIAGGYLRDHVLERDINDIDVYIDARMIQDVRPGSTYEQLVDKIFEYTMFVDDPEYGEKAKEINPLVRRREISFSMVINGYTIKLVSGSSNNYPQAKPSVAVHSPNNTSAVGIISVVTRNVTLYCNPTTQSHCTIQFIFLSMSPLEYIDTHFSCDISKIYYDGKKTTMTSDFINAVLTKTITFKQRENDKEAMFNYYVEKIKEKYPDYSHNVMRLPSKC